MITTNEAYVIATNLLSEIPVDVGVLENVNKHEVRQRLDANSALLPVFTVKWGDWHRPKVEIVIDGRNRGLLSLRLEDESFSKWPASLIKERDRLFAIPDEEFQKYSPLERSNLVVRFSAIQYPPVSSTKEITNAVVSPVPAHN